MRGRNRNNKGHHHNHNPLSRVYESNGPEVKIRGNAAHVAEKYMQLARDAQSSGDPVAAENFFQHAEHYFRMIAAAQEQFRQSQPYNPQNQGGPPAQGAADTREEDFDDEDDGMGPSMPGGEQPSFGTRDPQPYLPQNAQFFSPRDQQNVGGRPQHQQHPQHHQNQHHNPQNQRPHYQPQQNQPSQQPPFQQRPQGESDGNVDQLPSFITGGGQPQGSQGNPPGPQGNPGYQGNQNYQGGQNGYDNQGGFHRRRRRHRGPRHDMPGGQQPQQGAASEGGDHNDDPAGPRQGE